nr:prepilin-type cleavage/methylation domain-containing protein [Pseudomonadota bacterium]
VVAIVGILAAIAYPSYVEQVRRGQRTDATAALLDLAQRLERCRTVNGTYDCLPTDEGLVGASPEGLYDLYVTNAGATTYTIEARPRTGTAVANDSRCGRFALDQAGRKGVKDSSGNARGGDAVDYCW